MTPEEMTGEQLLAPREITACVEATDETWSVTLSCGHETVFITRPPAKLEVCSQCVDILLERRRRGEGDLLTGNHERDMGGHGQ
jgi:hypothetical protein